MYPLTRLRRNRVSFQIRDLVAETCISASNLILPLFVIEGHNQTQAIRTMPGVCRFSIDQILIQAQLAVDAGIKAIALFPVIESNLKSHDATEACNPSNLICQTVKAIKNAGIKISVICDVALDPYTINGHDGIVIADSSDDYVDNDITVKALCNQALVLAQAGVDILAPSDMMDGRVSAIRHMLDNSGFINISILSYAAKYSSNFYGPFRDALNNQNLRLDKSSYQMDYRNIKEAMREIEQDIYEGADMIMIKPALPYLDVIYSASKNFNISVLAYQVSGEYSMLKYASDMSALHWESSLMESLICIRRAGATAIITYAALEAANILNKTI